jgi:RNA polymerase sigma factor (sigma-70 family)
MPPTTSSTCPAMAQPEHDGLDLAEAIAARGPALRAFARRLCRQDADVDDLVQETLAKALAARHRFQPGTNLRSWLFTIERNTFNTSYQRGRHTVLLGADAIELALPVASLQMSRLWARETLRRLAEDLTPPHREVPAGDPSSRRQSEPAPWWAALVSRSAISNISSGA